MLTRNYLVWFSGYRCLDHCLCIMQVFLTKHYRNRRSNDPEFVLDLEEIYVIDSKTKSITRARVLVCMVTVRGGRKRDRKDDLLVIRDNETVLKLRGE
ncbi:hypothetical protein F2Q70_00040315 [Brassica cretica]|uniref:Uncharacterized protein n=1 Tax=Brassica cretica TaxID=69181 RepID=A0A8S9KAE6_BRACR|nr:hypothetical protein F2Q70_00040315 [Brassica cretica]